MESNGKGHTAHAGGSICNVGATFQGKESGKETVWQAPGSTTTGAAGEQRTSESGPMLPLLITCECFSVGASRFPPPPFDPTRQAGSGLGELGLGSQPPHYDDIYI